MLAWVNELFRLSYHAVDLECHHTIGVSTDLYKKVFGVPPLMPDCFVRFKYQSHIRLPFPPSAGVTYSWLRFGISMQCGADELFYSVPDRTWAVIQLEDERDLRINNLATLRNHVLEQGNGWHLLDNDADVCVHALELDKFRDPKRPTLRKPST